MIDGISATEKCFFALRRAGEMVDVDEVHKVAQEVEEGHGLRTVLAPLRLKLELAFLSRLSHDALYRSIVPI